MDGAFAATMLTKWWSGFAQIKILPTTSQYFSMPFGRTLNVKLWPQIQPLRGGEGRPGPKMLPIEVQTAHSYSTSIQTLAFIALFGHNTQRGRQADRMIGMDRATASAA